MKYRRLRNDELAELETEFVRFLAANSIPAKDWEKIKEHNPQRVNELLDKFSEVVYEKVIANVEFLEFRTPKDIKTFYCEADTIHLLGLSVHGESTLDFTKNPSRDELLEQFQNKAAKLQIYHAKKSYQPDRNTEIFRMMESGALIAKDGGMYKILKQLVG